MESFPVISMRLIKTKCFLSMLAGSSRAGGGWLVLEVDRMPCFTSRIWPLVVAGDWGRCFRMSSAVRPGHVANLPASMASIQVDLTGLKAAL